MKRPADVPRAALEIRFVAEGEPKDGLKVTGPEGESLWVEKEIVISSADVAEVHVGLDMDLEHYGVTLFFTPQAAQRLHDATAHNLGRQVAVLLNGIVVIAPRVQSPLGPSARISGNYTREAATKLAEQLAP
ncbi:MAG: hypothetical protein ABJC13_20210 [Acidobacteriota bacterium]